MMRLRSVLGPLGLVSLCLSVLVGHLHNIPAGDFFVGLFAGMAVALAVGATVIGLATHS